MVFACLIDSIIDCTEQQVPMNSIPERFIFWASVDELDKIIRNNSEIEELHIGGTMTMGSFILPTAISEFRKICPQ